MKITKEKITQMQTMRMEGKKQLEIANLFNVSLSAVQYHTNEETKNKIKSKSIEYQKNLSPEKKKEKQNRQKEYQRNYQRNKYKTNEEFRRKMIEYATNYKKKKREVGVCQS